MKASIIFNPQAGTHDLQDQIQKAGTYLQQQGWHLSWCETGYAGHATHLAHEIAQRGEDVAIAVGGDGTINEVMNGLVGSKTAIGILPAGTGNVFAAEMHIPVPGPLSIASPILTEAAEAMVFGQTRQIDVAKATFSDGTVRYFLMWAGIGLDAAISYTFELDKAQRPARKSLGMYAWLISGLSVLRTFRGKPAQITVDDETIDSKMLLTTISNSQLYGRFWRLSPDAKIDDGLLDIVIMEGYSLWSSIRHVVLATLGRHVQNQDVYICRTRRVRIQTASPTPVHLDAENVGFTPVKIEVVPRAVKIILPQTAPEKLFLNGQKNSQ